MNRTGQIDNFNECQFYNVSCSGNQCALGRTWNTYKCNEDCRSKYYKVREGR